MKIINRQWWSSIPPISTKRTITSHLNWTRWTQKKHPNAYYFGHSGPGLGQAQRCGGVTPVNGISALPSCVDMFVKVEQLRVLSSIIRKVWKILKIISDPVNRRTANWIATKKRQTMKYNALHLKRKTNS